MMKYKGYVGNVQYSDDGACFHGRIINIRDMVTFEGQSVAQLKKAFKDSVNDYLEFCAKLGEEPNRPYTGHVTAEISPILQQQITQAANDSGLSLNDWIANQLERAVSPSKAAKRRSSGVQKLGSMVGK